ncbi:MAG: hypothetical protein IPJ00_21730 [Saprospirales bacterium]|nr:hypothetical protein [Saprospirales bacterium]
MDGRRGKASAKRLTGAVLNETLGSALEWSSDSRQILYKSVLPNRGAAPQAPSVPKGPVISLNAGKAAPARTYQDLLKNPHDEALFAFYTQSQLMVADAAPGVSTPIGAPGMISNADLSPDGNFLGFLHQTSVFLPRPGEQFPEEVQILDRQETS